MDQLICHLIGDYVLQNHVMATKKTSSWVWAGIHAFCYGLPFLFLTQNWTQWAIIIGTHMVIDRLRLAKFWVDFYGNGKPGWLPRAICSLFVPLEDLENVLPKAAPDFLAVWLLILVDNTFHLTINYLTLRFV